MKGHVWRPLYVVIGIVVLLLLFRFFYVPDDFGIQEQGYTFGFHRLSNEQEWKDFPAKYKGTEYCNECHDDKVASISASQHEMIPCEDCHGPARNHPEDPEKLVVNRSRELCIRCHSKLYMPSSGRNDIPGIDPGTHNTGMECAECHNPHNPSLEDM
ncbi:cytochrome c3 family protein [Geothermobacter hydrogeniphilus]|uniref:Cytochrome C n=1 Tax=Geothermobacter hydrogeniphilus TaxID=1969733 RepID=A0A1X0Y6F1_9BACT|nr:cytochrome c3 family protein [Geothermobacter hydrogeniphilus]ORJ60662.1 cytochrome C [Geothermobacter hydrogeniphilus]